MTWECSLCTLVNPQNSMRCKVCETPRGSSRRKAQSTALRSRLEEESQMLTMVTHADQQKKKPDHHSPDDHPSNKQARSRRSNRLRSRGDGNAASKGSSSKTKTSNTHSNNSKKSKGNNSATTSGSTNKKAKIQGPKPTIVEVSFQQNGKKVQIITFPEPPTDSFAFNDGTAFAK
eukprot:m.59728 g.59728  ORF g.59728 m.59728 type:complete len:175 (-) comp11331_c0_seq1:1150-1674(-)